MAAGLPSHLANPQSGQRHGKETNSLMGLQLVYSCLKKELPLKRTCQPQKEI